MNNKPLLELLNHGDDCREFFKNAYNNRYTWDSSFNGYLGNCSWESDSDLIKGNFKVNSDSSAIVEEIDDSRIKKEILSQLWEVAIHRVRRPFESVHGENQFIVNTINGSEINIDVTGKNIGDKYIINNNIVTMVHRHIHGNLINIFTLETIDTGKGYLSKKYTSQYLDPSSKLPIKPKLLFKDTFTLIDKSDIWVLSRREIETLNDSGNKKDRQVFNFYNIKYLSK